MRAVLLRYWRYYATGATTLPALLRYQRYLTTALLDYRRYYNSGINTTLALTGATPPKARLAALAGSGKISRHRSSWTGARFWLS